MIRKLQFSSFQLIINEKTPNPKYLTNLFGQGGGSGEKNGQHYREIRTIVEDRFYFMSFNMGEALPRPDVVLNTSTGQDQENPRSKQQVELKEQLFIIYDLEGHTLYLSNSKKKDFAREAFKMNEDDDVEIKNIYSSIGDFIKKIKTIDSIKLTAFDDLISRNHDAFEGIHNLFGYGTPEKLTIMAKYNLSIKEGFKEKALRLLNLKNEGALKSLVFIGRDDRSVESVFNVDSLIQKIYVDVKINDENLLDPTEVKDEIIKKLK